MKKSELKQIIKPLVKECIYETLVEGGLLSGIITEVAPLNQIKVLAYKEKGEWTLETKYNIGKKKVTEQNDKTGNS